MGSLEEDRHISKSRMKNVSIVLLIFVLGNFTPIDAQLYYWRPGMLRNILRELFGTEFNTDSEKANFKTNDEQDDQIVIFPLGTGITKEADVPFTEEEEVELGIDVEFSPSKNTPEQLNDMAAVNIEEVEETAIDIEFPETVYAIKPIDTNFLLEEGSGAPTWSTSGAEGGAPA